MQRHVLVAIALVLAPLGAAAQDQAAAARSLAATCANCHGTAGRSVTGNVVSLAGLPKEFMLQQFKDFKDGKRPATVMHQLAKGYTDQQIELIADYFAAQKK